MKKKIISFVVCFVSFLMIGSSVIYAMTGSFVIHKVDQNGAPVKGAKFEVYGKPVLTEAEETQVTITKVWVDADNADNIRPDEGAFVSALHLLANGEEVQGYTPQISVQDKNTWSVTYQNLPIKDDSGQKITYTVSEDEIEHYMAEGSPAADGETITNTAVKDAVFYKVWDIYDYYAYYDDYWKEDVPAEHVADDMLNDLDTYLNDLILYQTTVTDLKNRQWLTLKDDQLSETETEKPEIKELKREEEAGSVYGRGEPDATFTVAAYQITYKNVPMYDTDGKPLQYIMVEDMNNKEMYERNAPSARSEKVKFHVISYENSWEELFKETEPRGTYGIGVAIENGTILNSRYAPPPVY